MEQQTNRLAKMLMKSGKMDAAAFFLLIKVLMNVTHDGTQDEFGQMLNEAVTLGVDYMQRKDFQINGFLQDTDNLRSLADKLQEALMANDIEYSKFLMQIQKMVRESLSEQNINADVYIQKVTKNNNTEFMALVIHTPGEAVSPQVYLDSFFAPVSYTHLKIPPGRAPRLSDRRTHSCIRRFYPRWPAKSAE